MEPIFTVVLGLVGTVGVAIITYLSTRRTTSGNLEASKAEDLWGSMRSELERYQTESTSLRTEMAIVRLEMVQLREEAALSRTEIALARVHLADLNIKLIECHEREKELALKPRRTPKARSVKNE